MTPTPTPTNEIHQRVRRGDDNEPLLSSATEKKIVINDLGEDVNTKFTEEYAAAYEKAYKPPSFTLKEIRDAVPAHLFEKDVLKSFAYLAIDLFLVYTLFTIATYFQYLPAPLEFIAWPIYWWYQGVFLTGVWVVGHECGHQSFSSSRTLNNIMGLITHSALLVPYHSWRITHQHHHAHTAHMTEDNVYLPERRSVLRPKGEKARSTVMEAIQDTSLYHFYGVALSLTLGWPAYLFYHKTGQKYAGRIANHFLPSSPVFEPRHRRDVLTTDAALVVVLAILGYAVYATSFLTVVKYYGIPYLFVNGWLVAITILHHTDVYVPHYSPEAWNYVRGALTTIDRDYGWFLNHFLHHVHDSHVAHHLFSQMPHFNAIKATPYLKEKLGEYYLYDRTPVFTALMRAFARCVFIEDEGGVLFYKSK